MSLLRAAAAATLLLALAANLAGRASGTAPLWAAGAHLATAGAALGAVAVAATALRRRGNARALRLPLSGLAAVLLFALARWGRGDADVPPDSPLLALEVLGAALLFWGGWVAFRRRLPEDGAP